MVDDHGNELPATTVQQINQKFDNGSARIAGVPDLGAHSWVKPTGQRLAVL